MCHVAIIVIVGLLICESMWHWSLMGETLSLESGKHSVVLTETPRLKGKSWSAASRFICDHPHKGKLIMLHAMRRSDVCEEDILDVGVQIHIHTTIKAPMNTRNPGEMDYGTWLRRHGFVGTAFCFSNQWNCGHVQRGPKDIRARLRSRLSRYIDGRDLAVVCAMSLGDRTLIDKELRADFSSVGASHVLALSGLHLSILVMIYSLFVLSWLKRRRIGYIVGVLLGGVLMAVFVYIVGAPVSLVRSALMLLMALVCSVVERRGLSLNNICFSVLILIVWNPANVLDVGFQLSFVAVTAIVLAVGRFPFPLKWRKFFSTRMELSEMYREKVARKYLKIAMMNAESLSVAQNQKIVDYLPQKLPVSDRLKVEIRLSLGALAKLLWGMTIVSLAAQFATLPLVVYYFHVLPVYGLFLNFLLVPLTYIILILSILFFAIPPANSWVALGLHYVVSFFVAVVGWFADLPGGKISIEWEKKPPFCIFYSPKVPKLECAEGYWKGNVMFSPYGRVVRIDSGLPKGYPQHPFRTDYLWICRGARGSLAEWCRIYNPRVVILDATLNDYSQNRYTLEAQKLSLSLYPLSTRGAFCLFAPAE